MAKNEYPCTDVQPVLIYGHDGTVIQRIKTDTDGILFSRTSVPDTPAIVNVATAGAGWTLVATGLTGVRKWRLAERDGNDFRYAFVAAPAAYMTGFGWVSEDTEITDVYVQRITADINVQLITWT